MGPGLCDIFKSTFRESELRWDYSVPLFDLLLSEKSRQAREKLLALWTYFIKSVDDSDKKLILEDITRRVLGKLFHKGPIEEVFAYCWSLYVLGESFKAANSRLSILGKCLSHTLGLSVALRLESEDKRVSESSLQFLKWSLLVLDTEFCQRAILQTDQRHPRLLQLLGNASCTLTQSWVLESVFASVSEGGDAFSANLVLISLKLFARGWSVDQWRLLFDVLKRDVDRTLAGETAFKSLKTLVSLFAQLLALKESDDISQELFDIVLCNAFALVKDAQFKAFFFGQNWHAQSIAVEVTEFLEVAALSSQFLASIVVEGYYLELVRMNEPLQLSRALDSLSRIVTSNKLTIQRAVSPGVREQILVEMMRHVREFSVNPFSAPVVLLGLPLIKRISERVPIAHVLETVVDCTRSPRVEHGIAAAAIRSVALFIEEYPEICFHNYLLHFLECLDRLTLSNNYLVFEAYAVLFNKAYGSASDTKVARYLCYQNVFSLFLNRLYFCEDQAALEALEPQTRRVLATLAAGSFPKDLFASSGRKLSVEFTNSVISYDYMALLEGSNESASSETGASACGVCDCYDC